MHQPKNNEKDKYKIIDDLAQQKVVEHLIGCVVGFQLPDLAQDLYIDLLDKDSRYIMKLYNDGELNYYIIGCIRNNVFSTTSRYYKQYKRFNDLTQKLDDINNDENILSN